MLWSQPNARYWLTEYLQHVLASLMHILCSVILYRAVELYTVVIAPSLYRGTGYCFDRFLCLYLVSLSARLRENGWTDLHEIFRVGMQWLWDDLIQFWGNSEKPCDAAKLIFFVSICQHYQPMAGPICMKFSGKVYSDHGTWLHFWSIPRNRAMPRCTTRGRVLLCYRTTACSVLCCTFVCGNVVLDYFLKEEICQCEGWLSGRCGDQREGAAASFMLIIWCLNFKHVYDTV